MYTDSIAIIDDNDIYHFIMDAAIKKIDPSIRIIKYMNGSEALEGLQEMIKTGEVLPKIMLLDINMPITDGWMFMEEYSLFDPKIKNEITIYMTSSTLETKDIERAKSYADIKGFLSKPISAVELKKALTLSFV